MDILIKNMEMPKSCDKCPLKCVVKSNPMIITNKGVSRLTKEKDCPLIPVPHCKDCENFDKETDICTLWGSWTNEDGFCHKAVVLERTT